MHVKPYSFQVKPFLLIKSCVLPQELLTSHQIQLARTWRQRHNEEMRRRLHTEVSNRLAKKQKPYEAIPLLKVGSTKAFQSFPIHYRIAQLLYGHFIFQSCSFYNYDHFIINTLCDYILTTFLLFYLHYITGLVSHCIGTFVWPIYFCQIHVTLLPMYSKISHLANSYLVTSSQISQIMILAI